MTDPITNRAAQAAAEQASQQSLQSQTPGSEQRSVDPRDQAAFEASLNNPQAAEQNPAVSNVGDDQSIGNAMLDGLEKMTSSLDERSLKIHEQLNKVDGNMSIQECMQLQVELMQLHLEQESIVKIGDKTSQGVQTMFKADK
ncbi:MAG: EscI/YscI/HrpB family type III secretion system inner rod protein [Planctomycetota bacterium]